MKKFILLLIVGCITLNSCNTSKYYFRQRIPVKQTEIVQKTGIDLTKTEMEEKLVSDSLISDENENNSFVKKNEKINSDLSSSSPIQHWGKKPKNEITIVVDKSKAKNKTVTISKSITKEQVTENKKENLKKVTIKNGWEDFTDGVFNFLKIIFIAGILLFVIFIFTGSWLQALIILGLSIAVILAFFLGVAVVIGGLLNVIINSSNSHSSKLNFRKRMKIKNTKSNEDEMLMELAGAAGILILLALGFGEYLQLLMLLGSVIAGLFLIGFLIWLLFQDSTFFWSRGSINSNLREKRFGSVFKLRKTILNGEEFFIDAIGLIISLSLIAIGCASFVEFLTIVAIAALGALLFGFLLWLLFHNFADGLRDYRHR